MTTWKILRGPLMIAVTVSYIAAAATAVGVLNLLGSPPPPYTDPSLSISNALGGVGRNEGWTMTTSSSAATDALADASIPTAIKTIVEDPSATYFTRFVTVKRTRDNNSDANLAICVRLGPTTNAAPGILACAETNAVNQGGGCYLIATGDSCTFTIRPILQCTSYATCHQPLWVMASGGTAETSFIHVSVTW